MLKNADIGSYIIHHIHITIDTYKLVKTHTHTHSCLCLCVCLHSEKFLSLKTVVFCQCEICIAFLQTDLQRQGQRLVLPDAWKNMEQLSRSSNSLLNVKPNWWMHWKMSISTSLRCAVSCLLLHCLKVCLEDRGQDNHLIKKLTQTYLHCKNNVV